jgi:hypothetical protein
MFGWSNFADTLTTGSRDWCGNPHWSPRIFSPIRNLFPPWAHLAQIIACLNKKKHTSVKN